MASVLSDDRLLAALRAEGVDVVEHPGWRTRQRPASTGGFGPINGVMVHHTVTSGTSRSVDLCVRGHSTLPGPLCHLVIGKEGQAHLISNGRANHAGRGDSTVFGKVRAESYDPDMILTPTKADMDGNVHFYGFECVNLGDGKDPWPEAQRDCIVRSAAAICRTYGWTAASVIGHLEWQPGKPDPRTGRGGVDVSPPVLRRLIDERLAHPASWKPNSREESSVAITISDDDARRIARAVWETDGIVGVSWGSESNPEWKPESVLQHIGEVTRESRGRIKALQAEVGALKEVIVQLATGGGLSVAEIKAAAEAGAQAALDRLGDALTDADPS
jgi:hypothetical protein